MPEKPATAAGYTDAQLEMVRGTCLYVATKLGDLMDDLVIVGGLVPSLMVSEELYLPNTKIPAHTHATSYVSIVLCGGFREDTPTMSRMVGTHGVSLHPAGVEHSMCIGPQGAVRGARTGAWLHHVRRFNPGALGPESDLRTFLFGAQRASLERFRPVLEELQRGRCFYCETGIRGDPHVDHFIPWRRYPLDLGHNFVLAHAACNERKGDQLAAEEHLGRWAERNAVHGGVMAGAFDVAGLAHDLVATRRVAEWAYGQVERTHQGRVWVRGRELRALSATWRPEAGWSVEE